MHRDDLLAWRTLRIQCRIVEQIFGKGEFDTAGDELVYALQIVSIEPNQYRCRFDFDTSLGSHQFHEMLFQVEGIPDPVWVRFLEKVAELGLIEAGSSIRQAGQVEPGARPSRGPGRHRKG